MIKRVPGLTPSCARCTALPPRLRQGRRAADRSGSSPVRVWAWLRASRSSVVREYRTIRASSQNKNEPRFNVEARLFPAHSQRLAGVCLPPKLSSGRILANIDLRPGARHLFRRLQDLDAGLFVHVGFAAIRADLRRHILNHQR